MKVMKHKAVKASQFYKVNGGKIERLRRVCDRCGDGTFMAEHKDRWYCGKCTMTIWKKVGEEETKPQKPKSDKEETEKS